MKKKYLVWLGLSTVLACGCDGNIEVELPPELFTLNHAYDPVEVGSPYRVAYDNAMPDFFETVLNACMFNHVKVSSRFERQWFNANPNVFAIPHYTPQNLLIGPQDTDRLFKWCDSKQAGANFTTLNTRVFERLAEDLIQVHHEACMSPSGAPSVDQSDLPGLCPIVGKNRAIRNVRLGVAAAAALPHLVPDSQNQTTPPVYQRARNGGFYIKDHLAPSSPYAGGYKTWTGCHYRTYADFTWGMVWTGVRAWWNDKPGFADWEVLNHLGEPWPTARNALSVEFSGRSSFSSRDNEFRIPLVQGQLFVDEACGTVLIEDDQSEPQGDDFLSEHHYKTLASQYFRAYSDDYTFRADFLPYKANQTILIHQAYDLHMKHFELQIADTNEFNQTRDSNTFESLAINLLISMKFEETVKPILDRQLPIKPILEETLNTSLPKSSHFCGFTTDGVGQLALDYLPENASPEYFGGGVWIDRACIPSSAE